MKVLLISANRCTEPCPVFPLGIATVAGALQEAGHTVRQADVLIHDIPAELSAFQPEVIGIGLRNFDTVNSTESRTFLPDLTGLIQLCRKLSSAKIVLGGSGFSLYAEPLSQKLDFDFAVSGEGGAAFCRILDSQFHAPKLMEGVQDSFALPVYQPDILKYYVRETHMIPVQTKRGCPFHCAYCAYPAIEGNIIRERNFVKTAELARRLSGTHPDSMLYFVDSIFNDPSGLWKQFLRQSGPLPFTAFLTPFHLTESDCDLLAESGMVAAELGLDAASDRTLNGLDKGFSFRQAAKVCHALTERGIGVTTNIMFGGPGETWDSVREGIENLRTLAPAQTLVFRGIRIIPGAPICRTAVKQGIIPPDWDGLDSRYFFEYGIDPEKLHGMLSDAFAKDPCIIYPPQRKNDTLRTLHRFGYLKLKQMQGGGK